MATQDPAESSPRQAAFRIEVLGGFRVIGDDGVELQLSGLKERALLAYLAVTHPQSHQREALRELL